MKTLTAAIGTLCLVALVSSLASAEPQGVVIDAKHLYSVHATYVGDTITVVNDDTTNHTVSGQASDGEKIESGTIKPGQNYTLSFLFPVQFSFYDKYTPGNVGIIYTYNPTEKLPTTLYNKTSASDLYATPEYVQQPEVTFTESNATQVSFGDSNSTHLSLSGFSSATNLDSVISTPGPTLDNATVSANDTVQYWKNQAEMYKQKYESLLSALKTLLA